MIAAPDETQSAAASSHSILLTRSEKRRHSQHRLSRRLISPLVRLIAAATVCCLMSSSLPFAVHAETNSTLAALPFDSADLIAATDAAWLFVTSFLIFFMQAGFALLEAGAVGSKDIISILLKNTTDFSISSICYYLFGYAFHHGSTPFIGASSSSDFAFDDPAKMPVLLQASMFCATATTIISGAIACRFSFHAYMLLCVAVSGVIYPIAAGWIWGQGFLSASNGLGVIDFAGSGVVHLQGATIALTACVFVGPRLGRFIQNPSNGKLTPSSDFGGNSIVLTALGTLILFFGWLGFNPGSSGGLSGGRHLTAGIAAVNTVLAGSSGMLTGLFLTRIVEKTYNFWDVLNSTLAGLVAVTAACATVGPAPALGIGVLAAFTYHFTNKLILRLGIDDVVGAFSVHGTPGIVGLIAAGLFSRQDYIDLAYGRGVIDYSPGRQLGVQLLAAVCIVAWCFCTSSLVLMALKATVGVRVSEEDEIVGLDFKYHAGYAYETHNKRLLRAKKQIEQEQILGQKMRRAVTQNLMTNGGALPNTPTTPKDAAHQQPRLSIGGTSQVGDVSAASQRTPLTGAAIGRIPMSQVVTAAMASRQAAAQLDLLNMRPHPLQSVDVSDDESDASDSPRVLASTHTRNGSGFGGTRPRMASSLPPNSPQQTVGPATPITPILTGSNRSNGNLYSSAFAPAPSQSIPHDMPGTNVSRVDGEPGRSSRTTAESAVGSIIPLQRQSSSVMQMSPSGQQLPLQPRTPRGVGPSSPSAAPTSPGSVAVASTPPQHNGPPSHARAMSSRDVNATSPTISVPTVDTELQPLPPRFHEATPSASPTDATSPLTPQQPSEFRAQASSTLQQQPSSSPLSMPINHGQRMHRISISRKISSSPTHQILAATAAGPPGSVN